MSGPKPPFQKVSITWLDAYSQDDWTDLESFNPEEHPCTTEGYLIKETANYILIGPTVAINDGTWQGCAMMAIPKGSIVSKKKVRK